jgi:hypothetical protein
MAGAGKTSMAFLDGNPPAREKVASDPYFARKLDWVKGQNKRMSDEGRLLPEAVGYERALERFASMPASERANRTEEFDNIYGAWEQHAVVNPPRGDWGDGQSGGASMKQARQDFDDEQFYDREIAGKETPARATIRTPELNIDPRDPSKLTQDWSDASGASDAWWPDANDLKPETVGIDPKAKRQDWMDSTGNSSRKPTRAREAAPTAGGRSTPLFGSPEEARAWAKSLAPLMGGKSEQSASATANEVKSDKWQDEELLSALAMMDANTFNSNLGRAGTTIGAALAGSKPNYSFYDNLDEQAGRPVKNLQAMRESERQHTKDVSAEAEARRTENMRKLGTQETMIAQNVLASVDPGSAEMAKTMTGEQIVKFWPVLKERVDNAQAIALAEMRETGDTKRAHISAAAQKDIAKMKQDNQGGFAEAMKMFAENKAEELAMRKGERVMDRWEPKDPSILIGQTDKTNFAKMDHRTMNVLDFLGAVEKEFNDGGGRLIPGREKEALESYRTAVLMEQQKLIENGVLSGDDLKVLNELFKDPNSLRSIVFDDAFRQSLDGMKARAKSNLIRKADSLGYRMRANPIGSGPQSTSADPRPEAKAKEERGYSPSENKTYIRVNGKVVRTEEGNTIGR